jgi:hypothetical protein
MYESEINIIRYSNSGSFPIIPKSKDTSYVRPTITVKPNVMAIVSN